MFIVIGKTFLFEASHQLPNYIGPCSNLHGHSYKLEIEVEGRIGHMDGVYPDFLMDFRDLKKIVTEKVLDRYDHKHLNDIVSIPTAERILENIVSDVSMEINRISNSKIQLKRAVLWETSTSYAKYEKSN